MQLIIWIFFHADKVFKEFKTKEKSLEDFLDDFVENPVHRFEVVLLFFLILFFYYFLFLSLFNPTLVK